LQDHDTCPVCRHDYATEIFGLFRGGWWSQ
jgi:hypothetical protein